MPYTFSVPSIQSSRTHKLFAHLDTKPKGFKDCEGREWIEFEAFKDLKEVNEALHKQVASLSNTIDGLNLKLLEYQDQFAKQQQDIEYLTFKLQRPGKRYRKRKAPTVLDVPQPLPPVKYKKEKLSFDTQPYLSESRASKSVFASPF